MSEWDMAVDEAYGVDSTTWSGDVLQSDSADGVDDDAEDEEGSSGTLSEFQYAECVVSYAVGCVLGRWDPNQVGRREELLQKVSPFDQPHPVGIGIPDAPGPARNAALVDDPGVTADLVERVDTLIQELTGGGRDFVGCLCTWLNTSDLRGYFRGVRCQSFFESHLNSYSKSRRKAPIYWQLATPSSSYSVWVYLHAFTPDTLYKVQTELVGPKLAHEERRLESMRAEFGSNPQATERKQIAGQESFVEELSAFSEELKRVAPLWNPNLDDGVMINFAPLWRLVPHHKAWQKELKAMWEALRGGEYDWAQLTMHLWPERVVPKCATDRSLAIAHGLEDVFWVERADGKRKPRSTPTRPVEELVRERSSSAVKAALKSLLEAPVTTAGGGRGRRAATAAADGGIR
jgi:hypothetical protein